MTGEELKMKLDAVGISYAEVARKLGVFPQSFNKTLKANDVGSGTLEKISKILGKDMSFFYGDASASSSLLEEEVKRLREENDRLREELRMMSDPNQSKRESEVYRLWMEYMKTEERRMNINNRMFELYQKEKEG